jgi:hypothetical protein
MSRAQAICKLVATAAGWVKFDAVCSAVLKRTEQHKRSMVSAQLAQLVDAGKLKRRGVRCAFEYHATKTTLLDLRRVHANGKPRDKCAQPRRATPPPRATKAVAPKPEPKPQAIPKAQQKLTVSRPFAPTAAPACAERETVEQFLARGGRIQYLKPGESSETLALDARALNKRRKERLGITDPNPITD